MIKAWVGAPFALRTLRRHLLPQVAAELTRWEGVASEIADPAVRAVALDSLRAKRFHCEGAAVFALWAPPEARPGLVRAMAAVQSLSDFLDSLTDRAPDGSAWRPADVLLAHRPFVAAAAAMAAPEPERGDGAGAYAGRLAACARAELAALPGLGRVRGRLLSLASRYAVMQALKHGPEDTRAAALAAWHGRLGRRRGRSAADRSLPWPAYGAAAGSTLAMFRLYAWAAAPAGGVDAVLSRYDPHVGALHILLDAVVDGAEDAAAGDLNWIEALAGPGADRAGAIAALTAIAREARRRLDPEPLGPLLAAGLVAFYLSDPKAADLPAAWRRSLGRAAGPMAVPLGAWLARLARAGVLGARPAQLGGAWASRPRRPRVGHESTDPMA